MRLRRSPLLASAALLVGLTGAGCLHGTRYTPRRDGTARLVMQVNKLAVYKDGETIKLEDKPARLLRCSRRAAADTARGAELWASGERLARVSATLAALGVGAPAIIPIAVIAQKRMDLGIAKLVDGINRHNDASSCAAAATTRTVSR